MAKNIRIPPLTPIHEMIDAANNTKRALPETETADLIKRLATSVGMKPPVTATKPLIGLQDFHTSLGDRINERVRAQQDLADSMTFKYQPKQYVHSQHTLDKNQPPHEILASLPFRRAVMREDKPYLFQKDEFGKTVYTPWEPGYRVRHTTGPDEWHEYQLPESALIKPVDDYAQGGIARMNGGGKMGSAIHAGMSAYEKAKAMIEAEKAAKAPTIMTRSSITDLANSVRNQKGQYGAQRVERAADEIPNLEKLYQDQALMRAFTGDNARALMTIKPADFERYAAPLGELRPRSINNIVDLIGIKDRGGYSDVPFLEVNKKLQGSTGLPYISGHEGRHRNRAMDQSGEQAGLVQFLPRSELREPFERRYQDEYIDAIRKEMALTGNRVKPEKYDAPITDSADQIIEFRSKQRPTIDLPDLYAEGGKVEHMNGGGKMATGIQAGLSAVEKAKAMIAAEREAKYKELQNAMDNLKGDDKTSIIPMPNRWFLQPDKHPQQQAMVERVLEQTGRPRESFTSGAFIDPRTGQVLDGKIFEDVGVAINPQTNRPSMTAGKEAGIDELDKGLGLTTESNLVRNNLFKRTGGDPILDKLGFLATIERAGMGHKYGLSTEYGSPVLLNNKETGQNPTLRPKSRGDVFGMGDVVGQIEIKKGVPHDVYEKLFVAPAGMDVPGIRLHKAEGGMITDQQSPAVEALKQTVQDDGANKMLNLDLAKLAIMNQPQRKAGGGVVHMSKAGAATDAAMALTRAQKAAAARAAAQAAPPHVPDFKLKDLGGLMPVNPVSLEKHLGKMFNVNPWDVMHRNQKIMEVSGLRVPDDVISHGGQSYVRDWLHSLQGIGGASNEAIAKRVQNRFDVASREGKERGGNGGVIASPWTMGDTSVNFAMPVTDLYRSYFNANATPRDFQDLSTALRAKRIGSKNPWADAPNLDDPAVGKYFAENPNFRKEFLDRMQTGKRWQELTGINPQDALAAFRDPYLLGVTPYHAGHTLIEARPGAGLRLSKNPTYSHDFSGDYAGSIPNTPVPILLNDAFTPIAQEMRARSLKPTWLKGPQTNEQIAALATEALGSRADNISELINDKMIRRVEDYHKGLASGAFPPNDLTSAMQHLKLPRFQEGGAVHMEDGGDVELPTGGLSQEVGTNPLSIYNQNLPKPESSLRMHPRRKTAPDGEPSTMDIARQLGIMAKEQAGEEWDTLKANPVRGALDVLNRGMVAGNVGAPVDIVNMGLQGVNYLTKKAGLGGDWASEKPVMGSKWIEDKMNELGVTSDKHYPMLELAANFLNPVGITAGAAKAAPVVGKKVLMPLAEKGLTMYEKGQLTPGFKPTTEVFAGSSAQGADLVARDTAKARLAAGEDPALVWKETGWAAPPWAPNDLRFEISDHAMTSSAPAAVNAKLDKHNRRLANVYYAQEIKRNVAAGDAFDDAVVKAEATAKNAGLQFSITPEAEALALDPNVTRADLIKEFDKGKGKKISTIGKLSGTLDKYVDHDEFFAGYPDFAKKIKFKTLNAKDTNRLHGAFSPSNAELSMSAPQLRSKPNEALDTIIHELQHGVQSRERWNNGGNLDGVTTYPANYDPVTAQSKQQLTDMMVADNGRLGDLYRKGQTSKLSPMEIQELNHRIRITPEYSKYQKDALTFKQSDTPYALYQRLAGEAEARLAQGRRTLKPNERRDQYPYDPQHFKNLTGYDLNSIIANPVRASSAFSNGGAARHPSVEEMRIEMMERKHG